MLHGFESHVALAPQYQMQTTTIRIHPGGNVRGRRREQNGLTPEELVLMS